MFKMDFSLNTEAMRSHIQENLRSQSEWLRNRQNKTFSVRAGPKIYDLRYEIEGDFAKIYANMPDADINFVRPVLRLNVGALLLPESINIDDEGGYNPDIPDLPPTRAMGAVSDLTPFEREAINSEIQRRGLISLISENS